jgi:alpha-N-arabinofuranosidase
VIRAFPLIALFVAVTIARAEVVLDEQFSQVALSPQWEWRVPVAGPTYSLIDRPGWLRLRVPQRKGGYNHWVGNDFAPTLLTPLPEGDWEVETHVELTEAPPGSNFHLGLTIAWSHERLLTLGPFLGPFSQPPMTEPEVWLEPTGQGSYAKGGAAAKDVWLLFRKRGWRYEALLKRPGDNDWRLVGRYSTMDRPQWAGILGKTFLDGPGVTLDVDCVRIFSLPPQAESQQSLASTIRVHPDGTLARLDPRRYGQFVELMRRCFYGGFWAEMLTNRKFTGEVAASGVIEGWERVGSEGGAVMGRDNRVYYVSAQSQYIELIGEPKEHGVRQTGLELAVGVGLVGHVVLRSEGLSEPVTLSVRNRDQIVSQTTCRPTGEWRAFDFRFDPPPANGRLAAMDSFAITAKGPGRFWIGCASLMPADNVDGFRREVILLARKMHIPSLRYPGGNFVSGYHWEDGVGPRDRRPPRWSRAWSEWEWNDVGTHEYFRLCELLGCQPYLTVNAGEGTPTEAAAWVEYVNGAPETPQGRRRAANGRPKPWQCTLWSIGNEMHGDWQLGHVDATKYAIRTVEFARAMRAVDPGLELIGGEIDYLSVHHYAGDDPARSPLDNYGMILATPLQVERALAEDFRSIQGPGRAKPLPLIFDEWNVWTQHASNQGYEDFYQLRDGLYCVSMLNALVRLGEMVPGAHLAQTVNVLGALRTSKTQAVASPEALAFQLHAEHCGSWRVPIEVKTPDVLLPGAPGPLPAVDAVAMLSEDKRTLHLILLNRDPAADAPVTFDFSGFVPKSGTAATLSGPSFDSLNTFEQPDTVRLEERKLGSAELRQLAVPKHSAVALSLTQ